MIFNFNIEIFIKKGKGKKKSLSKNVLFIKSVSCQTNVQIKFIVFIGTFFCFLFLLRPSYIKTRYPFFLINSLAMGLSIFFILTS